MSVTSSDTAVSQDSVTIRFKLWQRPGTLAKVIAVLGDIGLNIGAIDIVRVRKEYVTRDITIDAADGEQIERIKKRVNDIPGVTVKYVSDRTFLWHLGGKIEVNSKTAIRTRDDLSIAYTPGVARVCMAIKNDVSKARNLTIKGNTVAIVTDGSAVLGLGDIGPEAAMPVMEGKAMLFKDFAGVNAFPLCLRTKDVDEIVAVVKAVEPGFGGINLEDISAPRCFEIERRLQQELDIPVFHDDQHGTAVVVTAALMNALKVVGKNVDDLKVVVAGVGAAGTACTKMLLEFGVKNIIGCDRKGAIGPYRDDLNEAKQEYARLTNPEAERGRLGDVLADADLFLGLSSPGIISVADLKRMATAPIVFAMSNPTPEIMPEKAMPFLSVMATGRSDYPNQINNVLCFPGIFRGILDCGARRITSAMKLAAAKAIAGCVSDEALAPDYIVPSVFDKAVAKSVASAVARVVEETGEEAPCLSFSLDSGCLYWVA